MFNKDATPSSRVCDDFFLAADIGFDIALVG